MLCLLCGCLFMLMHKVRTAFVMELLLTYLHFTFSALPLPFYSLQSVRSTHSKFLASSPLLPSFAQCSLLALWAATMSSRMCSCHKNSDILRHRGQLTHTLKQEQGLVLAHQLSPVASCCWLAPLAGFELSGPFLGWLEEIQPPPQLAFSWVILTSQFAPGVKSGLENHVGCNLTSTPPACVASIRQMGKKNLPLSKMT